MDIYWIENGQRKGPLPEVEIQSRLESGQLRPEMPGWHTGVAGWIPLRDLPALAVFFESEEQRKRGAGTGSERGRDVFGDNRAEGGVLVDAAEGSTFRREPGGQEVLVAAAPPVSIRVAWLRFFARMFDLMVACLLAIAVLLYALGSVQAVFGNPYVAGFLWVAPILYDAVLVGILGTTPGKLLLGLRLRKQDGTKLGFGGAVKRAALVMFLGLGLMNALILPLTLFLGFWMVRRRGETLWDKVVQTRVTEAENAPTMVIRIMFYLLAGLLVMMALEVVLSPWAQEMREYNPLTRLINESVDNP